MNKICLLLVVSLLTACASSQGFNRESMRGQVGAKQEVTDADIQRVLELKAQLPSPYRLAVYFQPPKHEGYYARKSWEWRADDKQMVVSALSSLKEKNIASDVFAINEAILDGTDNKSIRLAAARAGADAVVVITGTAASDRYNNTLGLSYILLVTPFFMPGTVVDGLFMVNASMWDVRNNYLYASMEVEGLVSKTSSAFEADEEQTIREAKGKALTALAEDVSKRVEGLAVK